MRYRYLFWLLPLLGQQSGCALLSTHYNYSDSETQIEQWIGEQQYGRALSALGRIEPKDPHYLEAANKRKQVEALVASYEQEIRQQNRQRLSQGNWAAALDSYDEALARLPESMVLKDGLAQLHQQQAEKLEQLELKRLKNKGRWLKQTLPIYRDIARVDPRNRNAKRRLEKIQLEAEAVADELALHGNRAQANNELEAATELLELAAELSSAPAIQESLNKLNEKRSAVAKKARSEREKRLRQQRAAEQQRQRTLKELLVKFEQTFAQNEFDAARRYLAALANAGMKSDQYRTLEQRLNTATDREASRLFEIGVNAYSRGQYAEAATHWREVLKLKPDNKQAKENLERAERVLEKLRELEQKQGQ